MVQIDITEKLIMSYENEELIWKVVSFAQQAMGTNYKQEKSMLNQLPAGIQATFATYSFETDAQVNGSFYDFFYQNNGKFAKEVLTGYQFFGLSEMHSITEQCLGAYFKLVLSGEIAANEGILHELDLNQQFFIDKNEFDFTALEQKLKSIDFLALEEHKSQFIKNHPGLFISSSTL